jgi:hypothetical protein
MSLERPHPLPLTAAAGVPRFALPNPRLSNARFAHQAPRA